MKAVIEFSISKKVLQRKSCHAYICNEKATHYVIEDYRGLRALSAYCKEDAWGFINQQHGLYIAAIPRKHLDDEEIIDAK